MDNNEKIKVVLGEIFQLELRRDMPRRQVLCQKALTLIPRESGSELWAKLQNELAKSLALNPKGSRAENIEEAIEHYIKSLEVYTREDFPENWAMIHNNLAAAFSDRFFGDRVKNLEQSIFYYEQALDVYTRQDYPEDWAMIQNNLGVSYANRIHGMRAENLEQAISHYKQALKVYTCETYPEDWAMVQDNLASTYAKRIFGVRSENLEKAIRYHYLSLEVYTYKNNPEDWANVQNNLALTFADRIIGNRSENLEQSIIHHERALKVYNRMTYPEDWAATQRNLAATYTDRIIGERKDNIEKAIKHCTLALDIYTRQSYPEQWASTQNNLAAAYWNRIFGERAKNLEQAINHYYKSLEVFSRQSYPRDWAMTLSNMALAYIDRIYGERSENLEQAIRYYQQVLKVYTRQEYPDDWADTQNNLATAFSQRLRGERSENIEQAIYHYQKALDVYTNQAYPERWAMVKNNLAIAFSNRIAGDKAKNHEIAIEHYNSTLEVYTLQTYPERWAMTQNNLATAYLERFLGERTGNLEKAIKHCQLALAVYTRQAYPEDWAMTQNNLAIALSDRINGEHAENIENAIRHYNLVLNVYTRQGYPEHWALTQNNLASAFCNRVLGNQSENIQQAIRHYRQALGIYTYQTYPDKCRSTSHRLGDLGFENQIWDLSVDGYTRALAAQEILVRSATMRASKTNEIKQIQTIPVRSAYAYIQLDQPQRAVKVLENGRTRLLAEALEQNRRDLELLPDLGFEVYYEDYTNTGQRYDDLLALAGSEQRPKDWQTRIEAAQEELQQIEQTIRDEVGSEYPEFAYFMADLPFDVIQEQAAETPLVYVLATSHGGLALILDGQSVQALPLDRLTDERIWDWLEKRVEDKIDGGYLLAQSGATSMRTALDDLLPELSKMVCAPLASKLKQMGLDAFTFIPTGRLALLPLHAAMYKDNGTERTLLDQFTISYAPSARALLYSKQTVDSLDVEHPNLFSVGNPLPLPKGIHPLRFARTEVEEIVSLFDGRAQSLYEEETLKGEVEKQMTCADYLHFACHGEFDPQEPLQSGLLMSHGEKLTLQDILERKAPSQARLAILSACQTAITDFQELPEEAIGLPSGFMQAGIPGVIGTLWPVNDLSTALLMIRFYQYHLQGDPEGNAVSLAPAEALRRSQQWLRSVKSEEIKTYVKAYLPEFQRMNASQADVAYKRLALEDDETCPFAHPYYWAGFTFTGI